MSLVARILEANGIPTLVLGSAMDIVKRCNVPRYLHSDLPLGNPCGAPYDKAMQRLILEQGLQLLTDADEPGTIKRSGAAWPGPEDWREDYSKVDDSNREALRLKGEQRRRQQAADKDNGATRASLIP
ncbi:MAG: hypothetical protein AB8B95_01930 [Pseudohongiellaceae bacterium]